MLNGISCIFDSEPDDPPKNPRDYSWTADTLAYPGNELTKMRSIWGSSATDVYAAGRNWGPFGQMYHYDGEEWAEIHLRTEHGGNIAGLIDLFDIFGFGANDIWAVGVNYPSDSPETSRLVIHYDGNDWREVDAPAGGWLMTMGASGPNDLWVGGAYTTMLHYGGSSWKHHSLPLPTSYTSGFFAGPISFTGNAPDNIYTIFTRWVNPGYLLRYDGTEWAVEDSFNISDHERLWMSQSGTLYSTGDRLVSRWDGISWETLLERDLLFRGISGTGDDNIFVVGQGFGYVPVVFHYNGIDWYEYPDFDTQESSLWDVWTDGREVFITGEMGFDTIRTIILHGR